MKLLVKGHLCSLSVHERPPANAYIKFRVSDYKDPNKQFTQTAGVPRKRAATKEVIKARLEEWFSKPENEALFAPAAEAAPAADYSAQIAAFIAEEYKYVVREHRDAVEVVLQEMASRLAERPLLEVSRADFKKLVVGPMEAAVAAKTWANKLSYMKRFWGWLVLEEVIEKDPSIGSKMPPKSAFGTHEDPWDEAWYQPVWEELGKDRWRGAHWQRVFEDVWWAGMDVKDVWQFQPRKHMLQLSDSAWKVHKRRSKESETIDQAISQTLPETTLRRWVARFHECGPEDYLHPEGQTYSDSKSWGNQFLKVVKKAQVTLGLPHRDVKSIRHTFATRWAKKWVLSGGREGVPMDILRMWLGHAHGSRVLEKVYAKWRSFGHAEAA